MALAVATLWDGNAGFRCAILGWCQSASAFGRELSLARPGGALRIDVCHVRVHDRLQEFVEEHRVAARAVPSARGSKVAFTNTRFHTPRPGCGNALNRFARKAHSSGLAAEAKSENIATASG